MYRPLKHTHPATEQRHTSHLPAETRPSRACPATQRPQRWRGRQTAPDPATQTRTPPHFDPELPEHRARAHPDTCRPHHVTAGPPQGTQPLLRRSPQPQGQMDSHNSGAEPAPGHPPQGGHACPQVQAQGRTPTQTRAGCAQTYRRASRTPCRSTQSAHAQQEPHSEARL